MVHLSPASIAFLKKITDPVQKKVAQSMIDRSGQYAPDVAREIDTLLGFENFSAAVRVYSQSHLKVIIGTTEAGLVKPGVSVIPPYISPYVPGTQGTPVSTWASMRQTVQAKCTFTNVLMGLGSLAVAGIIVLALCYFPYAKCGAAIGWFFSPPPLVAVKDDGKTVTVTQGELATFIKNMPAFLVLQTRVEKAAEYYDQLLRWISGDPDSSSESKRGLLHEVADARKACEGVTRVFRLHKERARMISATKLYQIRRNISDAIRKNRSHSVDLPRARAVPVNVQHAPVLTTKVAESFIYKAQMDAQAREFAEFKKAYAQTCKAAADDKEATATKVQALEAQLANYRNATDAALKSLQDGHDAALKSLQEGQDAWLGWVTRGVIVGVLATTLVVVLSNSAVLVTLVHSGGLGAWIARPIVGFLTRWGFQNVINAAALGAEQAADAAASAAAAAAAAASARTAAAAAQGFFAQAAALFAQYGPGSLAGV